MLLTTVRKFRNGLPHYKNSLKFTAKLLEAKLPDVFAGKIAEKLDEKKITSNFTAIF